VGKLSWDPWHCGRFVRVVVWATGEMIWLGDESVGTEVSGKGSKWF